LAPDWAKFHHLGYFLLNQFSPKQAVSTHGLFEGFNSGLMWMFLAFKLRFDGDILVFLPTLPKIRQNFIQFSGHTGTNQQTKKTNKTSRVTRLGEISPFGRFFMVLGKFFF
jgi:hypothetical protein